MTSNGGMCNLLGMLTIRLFRLLGVGVVRLGRVDSYFPIGRPFMVGGVRK